MDFETSGLDPFEPNAFIRCVSLASREACLAIDLKSLDTEALDFFWSWVSSHPGFLFHNALFDTLWCEVHGRPVPMDRCTSALFRHLSTEGWVGQSWSLKTAMTDVLLWPEQNTDDLYAWLKANKLAKGDMAQAPWEILGKYAALDAEATYLLAELLLEQLKKHPMPEQVKANLLDYEDNDVRNSIDLHREQQVLGMRIDTDLLGQFEAKLQATITDYEVRFFTHPDVQEPFEQLRQQQLADLMQQEPPRETAKGELTKRWKVWSEKLGEVARAPYSEIFNMDSPQQLAWLFYTALKFPVAKETDGGAASVDKKTLGKLGELGKLLLEYRHYRDRLKFATALRNVQINGRLHPSIQISATNTGRGGGGNQG